MIRPGQWTRGGTRLLGALASVVGGTLGLAALWQPLKLVADPSGCVGLAPWQSWAGLKLHVVAESVACHSGSFLQGDGYVPVMTISLAVTVSALIAGIAILLTVIGGIASVQTLVRSFADWLRNKLAPVIDVLVPVREPEPIPVRVQPRSVRRPHHPQLRRGPPSHSC